MPAGKTAAQGALAVVMIGGNFVNLNSGLPLDATKSDYLQDNNLRATSEGGTLQPNYPHGV